MISSSITTTRRRCPRSRLPGTSSGFEPSTPTSNPSSRTVWDGARRRKKSPRPPRPPRLPRPRDPRDPRGDPWRTSRSPSASIDRGRRAPAARRGGGGGRRGARRQGPRGAAGADVRTRRSGGVGPRRRRSFGRVRRQRARRVTGRVCVFRMDDDRDLIPESAVTRVAPDHAPDTHRLAVRRAIRPSSGAARTSSWSTPTTPTISSPLRRICVIACGTAGRWRRRRSGGGGRDARGNPGGEPPAAAGNRRPRPETSEPSAPPSPATDAARSRRRRVGRVACVAPPRSPTELPFSPRHIALAASP